MESSGASALLVLGLIVAWLSYRAGSSTGRAQRTWGDWRTARGNERTFGKLRWIHTATAGWAWVFLGIALVIWIGIPATT
jgi:hypothetical protein